MTTFSVITPFDPWKGKLCTCQQKYSFNPYTGCMHGCLYCYATYIPNFYRLRLKERLLIRLEKDLKKLPENSVISMSNSSDPYPPVEKQLGITRKCLELIKEHDFPLLVITKSDIVARDAKLLSEMKCAVSITVTGFRNAGIIEPGAPAAERRIEALKAMAEHDISTILRFDPIIPFINEDEVEEVLSKCDFVDQVVSSTLKLRKDSFKRLSSTFPDLTPKFRELYFIRGEKIGNSFYLPVELRKQLLGRIAQICDNMGVPYSFCREGFKFKARSCDGKDLINYS
jgi:DNA repair photolyase